MATKISLCMIAKNEEQNIGRCLRSVQGVVDEIIVVDTGSTDKTMEIAKSFGAKVRSIIWKDDFSEARNASLEWATGDWILFLDADEELTKDSKMILRRAVLEPGIEGYFIKIVNVAGFDNCPENSADSVFRLFRNKRAYRFRGAIHEQICDVILEKKAKAKFLLVEDLVIYHYGYLDSQLTAKDKKRRNRLLLEKELIRKPNDNFIKFHYAVELFRMGDNLAAAQAFDKLATELNPKEVVYGPRLMRYIALAYSAVNDWAAALMAVQRGLALFPDYADLYYYGGIIYYQQKEYGLAYEYFQKALQTPRQPIHYAASAGTQGFRTYYFLGQIAEKFCNEEAALGYYISSIRDNSSFPAAMENIISILQPRLNPDYTQYALNKICDVSAPQAKLVMGQLMFKHAAYGLALAYFADLPQEMLTNEILLCKAICLMQQQRSNEALAVLHAMDKGLNINPQVKFNKFLCVWLAGDRQKVLQTGRELLAMGLTEDTAAVVRLLLNPEEPVMKVLGPEGMTPVMEILQRTLALGDLQRCTLLLSAISDQSLREYHLPLGELFYQYGHVALAEQYLLRYLEENGDKERVYCLLAEIKQSQEEDIAAVGYYQKALQLEPNEPKYHIKLMQLYERLRKKILQRAAQKYPQVPVFGKLLKEAPSDAPKN